MIHISDVKKFERCPAMYWNHIQDPIIQKPFVYYNEDMMELVIQRLRIKEYFEGNTGDDGTVALKALKHYNVLINARFVLEDLRIKIPVMIKGEQGYILYFTYASCFPKESEAQGIQDHISVLNSLGIDVEAVYVIHLNASYVREDNLDVDQLLIITDCLYNARNHPQHTITTLLSSCKRNLKDVLVEMRKTQQLKACKRKRSKVCTRGLKCTYFDRCFPQPKAASILNLIGSAHKLEMYEKGIVNLKDADFNLIEGNRHQYAQIMADKNGGLFYDKPALRTWLNDSIEYPLSYLDFEWETFAFPPYQGMKPYDVLCFQYSLHIEEEKNAELIHHEYLGTGDCRIAFIEHLLADIPDTGTILVFNMDGAEKLRLKQLAKQFPAYSKQLLRLCDRMVDLSLPFSSGNFYHIDMEGLYSLKKLVTIFSDFAYNELDISYGLEAVRNWRMLNNLNDEEIEKIKSQLFTYCAMDTYAMILVYHGLLSLVETNILSKQIIHN